MPPDAALQPVRTQVHQLAQRCPGRRSPVRAAAVVPCCMACGRWQRWAEFDDAHLPPAAQHDGQRWCCDNQVPRHA